MNFNPQVITDIVGSHCIVLLYGWDVHIDAKIESPGFTRIEVIVGGVKRLEIEALADTYAPGLIVSLIREYAHDAKLR